ncbi:MAG: Fic family protein [Bacteroidales bacterium]|nr:Fic family protein [Bacteroidales bacterium]
MPVFFDLLKEEPEVSVRVVLGHFIFVYIHPYFDGNGRMASISNECNVGIRKLSMDSYKIG